MKNIKEIIFAMAFMGLSFAMPGMRSASMGGGASSAAGGGLPLLEVGIGLAILAVLIWWFDLRKKGKE